MPAMPLPLLPMFRRHNARRDTPWRYAAVTRRPYLHATALSAATHTRAYVIACRMAATPLPSAATRHAICALPRVFGMLRCCCRTCSARGRCHAVRLLLLRHYTCDATHDTIVARRAITPCHDILLPPRIRYAAVSRHAARLRYCSMPMRC